MEKGKSMEVPGEILFATAKVVVEILFKNILKRQRKQERE